MTDQTQQTGHDTEAAAMTLDEAVMSLRIRPGALTKREEQALYTVLAALDSAQEAVAELRRRVEGHEDGCHHEAWESRHAAELALVRAERDEARGRVAEQNAELDRLWYFIDHQPSLDDIITGRPDHYIVNGDHTGCDCGTDWTPPPVEIEWTAGHPYDDGRPGLCTHGNQGETNARQMASHGDGWVVLRRLVGPWRPTTSDAGENGDETRTG